MSDDENESEGAAEESGKSNLLYIVIAAVLIIACLAAIIILVVYFVVLNPGEKDSNDTLAITDDTLGQARNDSLFDLTDLSTESDEEVKIVSSRLLNFTDAEDYCKTLNAPKQLFFPGTAADEVALREKMRDQIPNVEQSNAILRYCGSDFFIGLRKILDKDWKTTDEDFVFGPVFFAEMFLTHEDPSEQCLGITEEQDELLFRTIDCADSEGWNCILCQSKCDNSSSGFCYQIYVDKIRTDFEEAKEYCEQLEIASDLATIKHKSILTEVTKQIKSQMSDECPIIGIGHQFAQNYESINGEALNYETSQIVYRPQRKSFHNCLGITLESDFKWEPIDCASKHCFVCN
uniref:C-type lectin domain-containing protein n=1 Tax=Strigamia maritima TaxID=126957 RepID=T1J7C1_STRMM